MWKTVDTLQRPTVQMEESVWLLDMPLRHSLRKVLLLELTAVVLYEPQVRKLSPHVAMDTMETAR